MEADRAKPRTTARAVTVITVVLVAMGALNRAYTAPYSTPAGQLALAAVLMSFGAALWWMHAMTRPSRTARLIEPWRPPR